MLIFILFSNQILGGTKVSEGWETASGGHSPAPPMKESQKDATIAHVL